jgi:hypothetical protein
MIFSFYFSPEPWDGIEEGNVHVPNRLAGTVFEALKG